MSNFVGVSSPSCNYISNAHPIAIVVINAAFRVPRASDLFSCRVAALLQVFMLKRLLEKRVVKVKGGGGKEL